MSTHRFLHASNLKVKYNGINNRVIANANDQNAYLLNLTRPVQDTNPNSMERPIFEVKTSGASEDKWRDVAIKGADGVAVDKRVNETLQKNEINMFGALNFQANTNMESALFKTRLHNHTERELLKLNEETMSVSGCVVNTLVQQNDTFLVKDSTGKDIVNVDQRGMTIDGTLVVKGNMITQSSSEVLMGDTHIGLNANYQGTTPKNTGITFTANAVATHTGDTTISVKCSEQSKIVIRGLTSNPLNIVESYSKKGMSTNNVRNLFGAGAIIQLECKQTNAAIEQPDGTTGASGPTDRLMSKQGLLDGYYIVATAVWTMSGALGSLTLTLKDLSTAPETAETTETAEDDKKDPVKIFNEDFDSLFKSGNAIGVSDETKFENAVVSHVRLSHLRVSPSGDIHVANSAYYDDLYYTPLSSTYNRFVKTLGVDSEGMKCDYERETNLVPWSPTQQFANVDTTTALMDSGVDPPANGYPSHFDEFLGLSTNTTAIIYTTFSIDIRGKNYIKASLTECMNFADSTTDKPYDLILPPYNENLGKTYRVVNRQKNSMYVYTYEMNAQVNDVQQYNGTSPVRYAHHLPAGFVDSTSVTFIGVSNGWQIA